MTIQIGAKWKTCFLASAVGFLFSTSLWAQAPSPATPPPPTQDQTPAPAQSGNPQNEPEKQEKPARPLEQNPASAKPLEKAQKPKEKAWGILREGLMDNNAEKRAKAVLSLGLVANNADAEKAAIAAMKDEKANVRAAAATALGSMGAASSKTVLEEGLDDEDPVVVLAAANSLLLLKDDAGYEAYYAVLTGERKATRGLIKSQLATLHDKKKMAQIGLDEGIGFIPFAGIPYGVLKMVLKDDSSGVRAAAARKLARDPDPNSGQALVDTLSDKNWVLRAAALEAIAQRGDRSLLPKVVPVMDDEKEDVRYRAAACVLRLSEPPGKKNHLPKTNQPNNTSGG